MSEDRHGWLSGWGALLTGIAAVVTAVVGYLTWAHPHEKPGQQSFSVPVNAGPESSQPASGTGRRSKEASLDFEVKQCEIAPKLVSCSLTVVSRRYDRRLMIYPQTRLVDSDGDTFQMTSDTVDTNLERNQQFPFKLAFKVNKDVVRPLTVTMWGFIDNEQLDQRFQIK